MSTKIKRKRLLVNIAIIIVIALGSTIAIKIAKGYRPNLNDLSLKGTGLLAVSSYPKQAKVLINDRLSTTTDDTLYLKPDTYQIEIIKEGFHPWSKQINIKEELVSIAAARLFPTIPATTPLTFYHVQNVHPSPGGDKIAFVLTGSPFNEDNGLYTLSLDNTLLGSKQSIQLTNQNVYDYTKATLLWSPDSSQILVAFGNQDLITSSHLLNAKSLNPEKSINDVTVQLPLILSQWQDQLALIDQSSLSQAPEFMQKILLEKSQNTYFSPDQKKVFYIPAEDIDLPENTLGQSLPSINPTPEQRQLKANQIYVYDITEGTNYLLPYPIIPSTNTDLITKLKGQTDSNYTTNLRWYPNSNQLIYTQENKVETIDYDGLNQTTIIETQILETFSTPSPTGNHLIILTNLNQKPDQQNLISLDLK
ncbi:PEGA domain-containing protein [Patescibacteria group bacterium]|nr:PEGA domain-containing protein [Patescibacteria group bacterium]MBU1457915.1 PEGA domain-containing protein [Patescibacteria group bacterium]